MAVLSRAVSALAVLAFLATATAAESTCAGDTEACNSQAEDTEELVALQTNVKEHQGEQDKDSSNPRYWPKGWCPCSDGGHGRIGTCLSQPVRCGDDYDRNWDSNTVYGCCGMKDQTKCNDSCNCRWSGKRGAYGTCLDGVYGCCSPDDWKSC